jgi:predicted alpha-1,6-mannanase (GH76 family)
VTVPPYDMDRKSEKGADGAVQRNHAHRFQTGRWRAALATILLLATIMYISHGYLVPTGTNGNMASLWTYLMKMVTLRTWTGIASRLALLLPRPGTMSNSRPYLSEAQSAIGVLQTWYNWTEGLWDSTGWWNGANCLTVLLDGALLGIGNEAYITKVLANTFDKAQQINAFAVKTQLDNGLIVSNYTLMYERDLSRRTQQGAPKFRNYYYDDEGWWLLAFLRAFDLTSDTKYLDMADSIFDDMLGGKDAICGGGIYWSKARSYKNAISNELFLAAAAGLANRFDGVQRKHFCEIATLQWDWFKRSGLVNARGTINDGLDERCRNNGGEVWTYNQGVILIALVELSKATVDASLLQTATNIAKAAIRDMTDEDGILHDPCEPNCGLDGTQFKGIFLRGLGYLQTVAPCEEFAKFIKTNAKSILATDTDAKGRFGLVWSGEPSFGGAPNASTHSSAAEAVLAAVAHGAQLGS